MCAKKKKNKTSPKLGVLWVVLILLSLVLVAEILFVMSRMEEPPTDGPDIPKVTESASEIFPATTGTEGKADVEVQVDEKVELPIVLDKGLEITYFGKYTGIFMEDGTNEVVSGVLMVIVKNTGDLPVQYAEITVPTSAGDAYFSLSTLPAGESVVLLEQNRMAWSENEVYSEAEARNIALFSEPLSIRDDVLDFQILDGALNIINISEEDISGDIVIYYKNSASDLYYGGITYRVRIEGGMKAGEIKQIMATHFSDTGSRIMFVTIG